MSRNISEPPLVKKTTPGEETGAEGTGHLQGTVKRKKRMRLTELRTIEPKIHWEPTKAVKASYFSYLIS
jgi:hypothetical protein